jgi:hypothetical protein
MAKRRSWDPAGPSEAWPVNHVIADASTATIYAGGGNEWFGPAVWKSEDLGKTWSHSSVGLAYAEGETPIKAVWSIAPNGKGLYAGVEPAGLFRAGPRRDLAAHRRPAKTPRGRIDAGAAAHPALDRSPSPR